jgi:beta-N-acetylhexosaminidase
VVRVALLVPLMLALPAALTAAGRGGDPGSLAGLGPRDKAALVVVSGLPAPAGVAGVIVRRWDRQLPRPPGALVFVDQEGGAVRAFPALPPTWPAAALRSAAEARAAGRAAGEALRREGVDVDLAPVLDAPNGPLGSRHFRSAELGVAFAAGLGDTGVGACAKHFPGIGSTLRSTDEARVRGVVRAHELAGFRAAIRARVPCVMVSHALYRTLGRRRASLEPATYRLLRQGGFDGVAITDSLGVLGSPYAPYWARLAVRAGADLLLFTSPRDAARAIDALVPLARSGELDEHVRRVLAFRKRFAP